MSRPYVDLVVTDEYIVREFDQNIDPIELMWHRDDENRLVEAIEPIDWLVQLEDQLPMSMTQPIFIPRHMWHRTIKGTGKLKIKIYKS